MAKLGQKNVISSYTIKLYKGLSYTKTFTFSAAGGPINLTGKIFCVIFKNVFPSTLTLSSNASPSAQGSYIIITDAVNGKFTIYISTDEINSVNTPKTGTWTLILKEGSVERPLWSDIVSVTEI